MPSLPPLTTGQWLLAVLAALCIGLSKSGFAGLSMVTVLILAQLFPPRESTGILLPLLICGDIGSVLVYRQHAQWPQIWRMLPPTILGVVAGYFLMRLIPDRRFSPVIGWIVLCMTALQLVRRLRPAVFQQVPHTRGFAWGMGATSGVTTMLANAAGPVMALYFMAIALPKLAFVGTSAWFFLLVNLVKVPFSAQLGLIHGSSLAFNVLLVPAVAAGILLGRRLISIVSQQLFEILVLIFATGASLRLIWGN
jgi:uncharacterized membrane protein YfcA